MSHEAIFLLVVIGERPSKATGDLARDVRLDRRCWGWFPTQERAEKSVVDNEGDPFEAGWYQWAAIQRVPPGSHASGEIVAWFQAIYTPGQNRPRVERVAVDQLPPWAADEESGLCWL